MNALVEAARQYIGVPFKHQGRTPDGLDCAGLVALALLDARGIVIRDVQGYGREPWRDGFEAAVIENLGPPIETDALEVGDIVLMNRRPHGPANHIAIVSDYYLGGLGLIHTRSDLYRGQEKGRVTEHRLDERWQQRITKVFR